MTAIISGKKGWALQSSDIDAAAHEINAGIHHQIIKLSNHRIINI